MKRLLTSIILTLTLCLSHLTAAVTHTSIAPLSEFTNGIICTAWSLNEKQAYWATALHCVKQGGPFLIQGDPANVVDKFENDDFVVLKSGKGAKALPISSTQPSAGDDVMTSGYPMGNKVPVWSWGRIMALRAELPVSEGPFEPPTREEYSLFTMPVMPGHSGSPVISHGEVVSIVQVGGDSISGGLEWRKLVKDTAKYVK